MKLVPLLFTIVLLSSLAANAETAPPSSAKEDPMSELFSGKTDGGPTFIDSDSLTLFSDKRRFLYKNNVTVKHGDMTMTAQEIEGLYTEKNQIKTITAKKDVVITKATGMKATGNTAVYDAAAGTVVLTDNPSIEQDGSLLSADKITMFLNENRSEAAGQVRVKLVKKEEKKG